MLAHLKNYVRLKTMPYLMNTIYVHMSMVKHGTWYFKIHLPFANISWSIRIWISCICSHISTSLLFPFFCQKREIRVSNVDGPWSCDAGLVQKVGSHLWHHQKKNLSLQPVKAKKLSKILTRQLNRKQGLGGKIVFSFLRLVKFEDSKQNGD